MIKDLLRIILYYISFVIIYLLGVGSLYLFLSLGSYYKWIFIIPSLIVIVPTSLAIHKFLSEALDIK